MYKTCMLFGETLSIFALHVTIEPGLFISATCIIDLRLAIAAMEFASFWYLHTLTAR
jgi:hypothetical protein